MPSSLSASSVADLELGLASSHPDRAAASALAALREGVAPLEVVRAAAISVAGRYDPVSGLPPHGLASLAAAADLREAMDARDVPLAVLQAVSLAASEKKLASSQPPLAAVSGEVTHLGRSAILASRVGAAADAEPLFLGIVEEGWERRMAGDILFRAALEDTGDGGHKLLMAVKAWQLARSLGFRDARLVLRPSVQYLLRGERDRRLYDATLAVLGREWVDLDSLVMGGRSLDEDGRMRLAASVAASTDEACVSSLLTLLRDGYAVSAVADGVGIEATRRLLAAEGYHIELVHVLLFARAARFTLDFSRTSERLYALFEAALRTRSPAPHLASVSIPDAQDEGPARVRIADDLHNRRSREAAAGVRAYLGRGYPAAPLASTLVRFAALDSSLANGGHNLLLAEACVAEYAATKAPEFLMALAKSVAASPNDQTASNAWVSALRT